MPDARRLRRIGWLFILSLLASAWADRVAGCFQTTRVPGTVITHSPARTRQFLGSPRFAILPDGGYRVSHDLFGPGSTLNRTRVYASQDRGLHWALHAEIEGQWWSSLFFHRIEGFRRMR